MEGSAICAEMVDRVGGRGEVEVKEDRAEDFLQGEEISMKNSKTSGVVEREESNIERM